MNVLVVGATGGSGRAAVERLLAEGHAVTAFARSPGAFSDPPAGLRLFRGDVMNPDDVSRAVHGHDAVIVTLGIRENALRVRVRGSAGTPMNVRSTGTQNVIDAMRAHGVRALVVQSSYGVGETRGKLSLGWRLMFSLVLKPQIADTEEQERRVRASGLDWVIVQPVGLTDAEDASEAAVSLSGDARTMHVSRKSVGRFLAHALRRAEYVGRSVALSAA